MSTISIPMFAKRAKKSLSMMEEFMAVRFLYRSNQDIFLIKIFRTELMNEITVEILMTATYLNIENQNVSPHSLLLSADKGILLIPSAAQ